MLRFRPLSHLSKDNIMYYNTIHKNQLQEKLQTTFQLYEKVHRSNNNKK